MDISIVIPAHNESKKIATDIEAASAFLKKNHLIGEVIVVDDNSGDGTAEAARKAANALGSEVKVHVISNNKHKGKGYAVRTGVKAAGGTYIMYADSGSCVPYDNMLAALQLLKNDECDIAHGSRKLSESRIIKPQTLYRRICSRIFHWISIHFMGIPARFTDTQCGFKVYKGDVARQLYNDCQTDGFMFEIEIILRALKKGYRIKEFAITWSCDRDSRLNPSRSVWKVISELKVIKKASKTF